jgi:hypothetical protein
MMPTSPLSTPLEAPSANPGLASTPAIGSLDDLGRVFNTALLTSRSRGGTDFSAEIQRLMASRAFHALLGSVRHLARTHGISEGTAAGEIIETVRRLDAAWQGFAFEEGLERLKS